MRVDGALVTFELVPSYQVDQLVSRVDPARDACQGGEDAPLGGGQFDGLSADDNLATEIVDDQFTVTKGRDGGVLARVASSPEDGLRRAAPAHEG